MSEILFYNTRTRKKETFRPIREGQVGIYTCGPTVYGPMHIGNVRSQLFADLLRRFLVSEGFSVTHVINITDVGHLVSDADEGEDKMEVAAQSAGESAEEIARRYTEIWRRDREAVNCIEPEHNPKATEHIDDQVALGLKLEEGGYLYRINDGIYFDIERFPRYTELARLDLEGQAGAQRIDHVEGKRHPADFAIWKFADPNVRRLQEWESPWGRGFPGWHLECSAMSSRYLGEHFDIHTGGIDLANVHHTNEVAQSECAFDLHPWVEYWLHNEFLDFGGEKMSKSKGNFLTVRDLTAAPEDGGREDWAAPLDPLALRLALISGHYAKPFNLTRKTLADAAKNLQRYRDAVEAARLGTEADRPGDDGLSADLDAAYADALAAMADDLNTPIALAAGLRGAAAILKAHREAPLSGASARAADAYLDRIDALLGIVHAQVPADAAEAADDLAAQVEPLVVQRTAARAAKDWARADAIRDELAALGVEVVDTPAGPEWRRTH